MQLAPTTQTHHPFPSAKIVTRVALGGLCTSLLGACGGSTPISIPGVPVAPNVGSQILGPQTPASDSLAFLHVVNVSVPQDAVWQINRPIDILFSHPIDFSTVNANTISLGDDLGVSSVGSFFQPLDNTGQPLTNVVRFQPNCPLAADYSDAGLKPLTGYHLSIAGANQPSGMTVQSTTGVGVRRAIRVDFHTPSPTSPATLFYDAVPGPPEVVVRGLGGVSTTATYATYLEIGGDPANRVYFAQGDLGSFLVPLNKYSEVLSQIALVVQFNQSINGLANNLQTGRIQLEYFNDTNTAWEIIPTSVQLAQNCVDSGATLRLVPLGLMPQGAQARLVLRQGFEDITGQATVADDASFALMNIDTALDAMGAPRSDADELLEPFALGGAGSLEDLDAPLAAPRAHWGASGQLQASFDFDGTGGPGGDFDFHVPLGQTVIIDTVFATIQGGPGGIPVQTQTVVNGVLDLRDLYIPAGSRLRFVGPYPATLLASGSITIEGELSVDGTGSDGVNIINTTNQPEAGASGNAGGGRGGTGSFLTAQSTPQGGPGFGAFSQAFAGGQGGETGFSNAATVDARRGAGGGGGSLGKNVLYDHDPLNPADPLRECQTLIGMDSEPGFQGNLVGLGLGAVNQVGRAEGGAVGPRPFYDARDDNDFFGSMVSTSGEWIVGELNQTWAGAGGGAGGDASFTATFPQIPFQRGGDEKGSGGGGGGGGLSLVAVGPIIIEDGASVSANGGHGGGGESTNFFDRVGGGSGGGSGGHIVMSSASFIDVRGTASNAGTGYRDVFAYHQARPISALGGEGGAGEDDAGGAGASGVREWRCDAIPLDRLQGIGGGTAVPPLAGATACFGSSAMAGWNDPGGPVRGAGGDGSPGIVQLHVEDPAANLRFTGIGVAQTWSNADVTKAVAPPPIGWYGPALPTDTLVPFFSRTSVGQSQWIPLGLARIAPGTGPDDQVEFFFAGTDPVTGSVLRTGAQVQDLASIIAPSPLQAVGTVPYVESSGLAIVLDGAALANDYKVNPRLLHQFSIVLTDSSHSSAFPVQLVRWLPGDVLRLFVGATDNLVDNFLNTATGTVTAELRPHYFRVTAGGQLDSLPSGTEVKILFDAAQSRPDGTPDEATAFSTLQGGPTGDITALNGQDWDYFRFRVVFHLNSSGTVVDPNASRPALDFLRLPFRY